MDFGFGVSFGFSCFHDFFKGCFIFLKMISWWVSIDVVGISCFIHLWYSWLIAKCLQEKVSSWHCLASQKLFGPAFGLQLSKFAWPRDFLRPKTTSGAFTKEFVFSA